MNFPKREESRLRGLHDWAVRHWFRPGRRVHRTTLGYQRRKPDTLPPVEHQRQPLVREGRDIRKLDRNLEQAIVFPNPTAHVRPIRRVHWEFQRERHLRHLLPISQRQGAWRNCRHPRAVALGRHARLGHNHLGEWCGLGTNAIDEHPYWRVRHKMACKILMGCDMELAFPNPCHGPGQDAVFR